MKVLGDYTFLAIHVFIKAKNNFSEIQFFQKISQNQAALEIRETVA